MTSNNGDGKPSRLSAQALQEGAALTIHQASEFAAATRERLAPVISQTVERVAPYADEAKVKAQAAKAKAAGWAAERVEQLQPTLYSALDRVPGAVDRAYHSLEEEVIPNLVEALHDVAGDRVTVKAEPVVSQAVVRAPKTHRGRRTVLLLGLLGAAAAVALAIRSWLSNSKPPQWSTSEPREAYVYPDDGVTEPSATAKDYESDSYIGANPPEGFVIKANARSKKYHLPEGRNYERTIAEVWFATEEAAQAAGFTKAEG